ncbi:MAG TPA: MFS transporter [Trueperaceae bacterium]|nr:MFS transporter [Trueperaceae bacterium]
MPGTPAAPLEGRDALGAQRPLTVGILLGVTLVAFESLAVVTVAPRLAEELGGVALYGWMFSGFLLASLLGTVVAGQMADTGTLARPLALGLAAFGLGLAVSGSAPTMLVVIAGRVLQGLGGGALSTVMLTAITRAYPDSQRARMMALTSSAWVVPALLGPTVAGFVAEALHWRLVFWGIVPLLLVVGAMTVPRFRHLDPPVAARPPRGRLAAALTLALGTGLFLTGLGAASAWLAALLAVPGAAAAVYGLRALMPAGIARLGRGLPAVVASRGLAFAAVVGVEVFLALMLTAVHGYSSTVTGAVIATGSVSWSVGSWLQSRLDQRSAATRGPRLRAGAAVLLVGLGLQVAALYAAWSPLVIVVAGWVLAGLGVGMTHATASVVAFALTPAGQEGRVSAALTIADQWTSAVSAGVGGALLALAGRLGRAQPDAIGLAMAFVIGLCGLAVLATWRSGPAQA